MEYLPGKKLYDAIREHGEVYAASLGKTYADLEREVRREAHVSSCVNRDHL